MSPLGHFSAGFIAKYFAPKINIWILFGLSWIQDIMFIIFALFGIEQFGNSASTASSIPAYWSHSLVMTIFYAILVFVLIKLIYKNKKYAIVAGALVLSHWALDIIVWGNLPLTPLFMGNTLIPGFNLYNNTNDLEKFLIELVLFIPSLIFYINTKRNIKNKK